MFIKYASIVKHLFISLVGKQLNSLSGCNATQKTHIVDNRL